MKKTIGIFWLIMTCVCILATAPVNIFILMYYSLKYDRLYDGMVEMSGNMFMKPLYNMHNRFCQSFGMTQGV